LVLLNEVVFGDLLLELKFHVADDFEAFFPPLDVLRVETRDHLQMVFADIEQLCVQRVAVYCELGNRLGQAALVSDEVLLKNIHLSGLRS
jgi:hypothetical protein